jgi:hypothetical protein
MRRVSCSFAIMFWAGAAAAQPASWIEGVGALVPQSYVAGTASQTDLMTMTGLLAAFPARANDPKTPGSAFDPGHVLAVTLERRGDVLVGVSATLRPRRANDRLHRDRVEGDTSTEETIRWFEEGNLEIAAKAANLPAGTVPCDLHAWSADRDPKGLNVRAEPSTKARVLGTLPPPFQFRAKNRSENTPEAGWLTEFRIVGSKEGWFLIEGAEPPGQRYEDEKVYPRKHPKPYAGRGWVHGSKIGAAFANGQTRMGGLFQAPHMDSKWMPAKREGGYPISADGGPKRVLACSGMWGLVESHDGVIGWWRSLCSNQVTNCS